MVDFDTKSGVFKELNVKIVAASVEDAAHTQNLAKGLQLNYLQVVHSVDAQTIKDALGVQTGLRQDQMIMHAAGFLIDPDGNVNCSVISSGPTGRFVPAEIMAKVVFEQARRS